VRSLLEHGILDLPYGDRRTKELIDELVLELTAFGYKNDKLMGVGAHDDLVMALSMLAEAFAENKSNGYTCAVNSAPLPLDISGEMEVNLSPLWESQDLIDLGIQ
jgi:hypothetical protein